MQGMGWANPVGILVCFVSILGLRAGDMEYKRGPAGPDCICAAGYIHAQLGLADEVFFRHFLILMCCMGAVHPMSIFNYKRSSSPSLLLFFTPCHQYNSYSPSFTE